MSIYCASEGNTIMIRNNPPPYVPQGLRLYINAFLELSTERSQSGLPWSCLVAYANYHQLSYPDRFIKVLQSMDATYMKLSNKQNESKQNAPNARNEKLKQNALAHGIR